MICDETRLVPTYQVVMYAELLHHDITRVLFLGRKEFYLIYNEKYIDITRLCCKNTNESFFLVFKYSTL